MVLAAALVGAAPATAAEFPPPPFTQVPLDGTPGSGANQLTEPRGVAVSPLNHHIYVTELANHRVSEFTAWGEFVRAFGWGVDDGQPELQACTVASTCQPGSTGAGPGQFGQNLVQSQYNGPTGIAVDSAGDVYVMDLANFRVQKFDAEGEFILTFGGEVNDTTKGNLCTKASGNTCKAGKKGTGNGEFNIENVPGVNGEYVAVGPDDTVYVGDKDRIQAFEPDGTFKASIPLPQPGNPGALEVDPTTGRLYFAYNQNWVNGDPAQPGVYRLEPDGSQVTPPLEVSRPRGIGIAPNGEIYVGERLSDNKARIVGFNAAGTKLGVLEELPENTDVTGVAVGVVGPDPEEFDVYVAKYRFASLSAVSVFGATPDPTVVGPPPIAPPVILEQFASSVGTEDAVLKAKINPKFWADTRFYVEYGTADCEIGPCVSVPAPPGLLLSGKAVGTGVVGPGITITSLAPGTTYHYRFVASSTGGGPVVGPDQTFRTAPPQPSPPSCPANAAFRVGAGASLPDCRAYEMVSPVDKDSSDIAALPNFESVAASLNKSAAAGSRLSYSTYKAFGNSESAPYTVQFMASRGAGGWTSDWISPLRQGPTLIPNAGALEVQFKVFDEDLCNAYLLQDTDLALAPGAVAGYANLYEQDLCGSGYSAITQSAPPATVKAADHPLEIQGIGGTHTVYRAKAPLIEGVSPPGENPKVYDFSEGGLSYVCVLPNGSPFAGGCSAGSGGFGIVAGERRGQVKNAVSEDGSRIYWTASGFGAGKIYLREAAATTIAVSKGAALFWGASPSGGRVVYTEAGNLYSFEPENELAETGTLIAGGVQGVAGMSEDAKVVYFASTQDLGGDAEAGKPNLYRSEVGQGVQYIATLSTLDVGADISSFQPEAFRHAARTTDDGDALAFISNNGLTGQDSLDANSGKPDTQVYLYRVAEDELVCASCNQTGARPAGRDLFSGSAEFWAAALLPAAANQLYDPRVLSDDGERLFFNSFDAIVQRDTNGVMDVYQWEAEGKGDCVQPGGCVSLISSGQSSVDSEFVDASADGSDVFFTTEASLVAGDPGLIDIYDARIGGGFPPPPVPPAECQGEACQNPAPPPNDPTPASAVHGRGNVKEKPKPCPKGKHRVKKNGRNVCVKNKKKAGKKQQKGQQNSKKGRAGR